MSIEEPKRSNLGSALTAILNQYGIDNDLELADVDLAGYLLDCLGALKTLKRSTRQRLYGGGGRIRETCADCGCVWDRLETEPRLCPRCHE